MTRYIAYLALPMRDWKQKKMVEEGERGIDLDSGLNKKRNL